MLSIIFIELDQYIHCGPLMCLVIKETMASFFFFFFFKEKRATWEDMAHHRVDYTTKKFKVFFFSLQVPQSFLLQLLCVSIWLRNGEKLIFLSFFYKKIFSIKKTLKSYVEHSESTIINCHNSRFIHISFCHFTLASWLVGWLVLGISTFVGYLTPNPFLCK